jgi:hypothetical protein
MPLPEPTYPSVNLVGVRKEFDYLMIAIKPDGASTVSWLRVPLLSQFDALTENNQDVELSTFVGADNTSTTLRARLKRGANIPIATAAHVSDPVVKAMLAAATKGTPVLFRGYYKSMELVAQGQATLGSRGMQGGTEDIPQWGFDLLIMSYNYYEEATGNLIA